MLTPRVIDGEARPIDRKYPPVVVFSRESTTLLLHSIRADIATADKLAARGEYLGDSGALAHYRQAANNARRLDIAITHGAALPEQWNA